MEDTKIPRKCSHNLRATKNVEIVNEALWLQFILNIYKKLYKFSFLEIKMKIK